MTPGSTGNVIIFEITNTGNATFDYNVFAEALSGGSAKWGGTDNINASSTAVYVESGATVGYQSGEDTATSVNDLAADGTIKVYIVASFATSLSDNDIASYYLLAEAMNAEKVTIQVRDRFRSEVIVSEREMTRHSEYDIDYETGSLIFREPIFSRDSDLNPVFIVVDYESYDANDRSLTYGGRAQVKIGDKQLKVGITHVNEGRIGGEASLSGVDATYQFGEETQLRLEYAMSDTSDNSQNNSGNA